jgi:uncharacterized protein
VRVAAGRAHALPTVVDRARAAGTSWRDALPCASPADPTAAMPAPTPPAYLDDDRLERLSALLEQRAVPFRGFNLEALDGFLSALVVGPSPVSPGEWQPLVWGGKPPRWDTADEEARVHALLMGHWNMCSARVRYGDDDLPDHLAPLLWLPEDPELTGKEALREDELDVGRDWALGFFAAVGLRETEWDRWLDENDWMEDIFERLDSLASGEVMDAHDPTAPPAPIGYRERLEIIVGLPGMLADLNHHRVEALTPREPVRREATPERNAPCPCGSGRKYKKCCGR